MAAEYHGYVRTSRDAGRGLEARGSLMMLVAMGIGMVDPNGPVGAAAGFLLLAGLGAFIAGRFK